MTSVSSVPAGWYKNPEDQSQLRWWDGLAWTDSTRPTQAIDTSHVGAYGVSAAQGGFAASTGQGLAPTSGQQPFNGSGQGLAPTSGQQPFNGSGQGLAPTSGQQPFNGSGQAPGWGPANNFSGGASGGGGGPVGQTYRMRAGSIPSMILGVLVGLVFVAAGLLFSHASSTPGNETASTAASVTSLNYGSNTGSMQRDCAPIASFTVGGTQYTATSTVASNCNYSVGETVTVRYDPSNPSEASVPVSGSTKMFSWLFVAVGALLAVLCVGSTFRTRARIAAGTYVQRNRRRESIRIGGPHPF